MARKSNHTFVESKMNKDLDARLLKSGEYRDGVNVSVSRSESDDVGALENILGNEFINDLQQVRGNPCQIIGWYIDTTFDRIFLYLTNFQDNSSDQLSNFAPYDSVNKIVYFNTKTGASQTIVSGSFLNFSINSRINDSNMIENLLFWTDNRNQPRKINVDTAIADPSYYFNEDHISVAKYYPHRAINLTNTSTVEDVILVNTNTGVSAANQYNAIYPFFILTNTPSSSLITLLTGDIGLQGYVQANDGSRYEFKLALFQQDGFGVSTNDKRLPGSYAGDYIIFVDRDLSSALTLTDVESGGSETKYKLVFTESTMKDVSSPWLEQDQVKLKIKSIVHGGFGTVIGYADNPNVANYSSLLYYFGTRSKVTDLDVDFGSTPGIGPTFSIVDGFPLNNTTATKAIFPRIKHHKLPEDKYFVSYISTTSAGEFRTSLIELPSLEDASTLVATNVITEYGLAVGDIITYHWPNKYYDQQFPGDPNFLEDKFIRFAYRFKYDDGEYSVISPFTQSVFIPRQDGYFLNTVGSAPSDPTDFNKFISQEQLAGQNTIVDFFVNKVSQVKLNIPLEFQANQLKSQLKVKEIDILYKESDGLALKVVETLDIDDYSSDTSTSISYNYQSRKPIKTLQDSEIGRVYDNVPIRAKTQSTSGNRIIYGNFFDRHTSPLALNYQVGVSSKFTSSFVNTTNSHIAYPNHTLKQNRNYQVGIILSDRYGRSTDVILSTVDAAAFEEKSGVYANSRISFGGSTVYSKYFDSVVNLFSSYQNYNPTPQANILTTPNPKAGIIDWPGDSLKIRFNDLIPSSISNLTGYPGLFRTPTTNGGIKILTTTVNGDGTETWTIEYVSGVIGTIAPGDIIEWNRLSKGTTVSLDEAEVLSFEVTNAASGLATFIVKNFATASPANNTLADAFSSKNPLGFYSYRIVVKQTQQDYYNVYLPSLLQGNPVVKPYKLFLKKQTAFTKILEVDETKHPTPGTFPILEGQKVEGDAYYIEDTPGVWNARTFSVVVTNIINDFQFEVDQAIKVAGVNNSTPNGGDVKESDFTSVASSSTLNVTTLLTDNANKIAPALNETTPVQQQYSTSNTRIIPRVALNNLTTIPNVPNSAIGSSTFPIFPGQTSLNVRAIGNFEAMFVDGKYAGLWQADTDPPTAVIENKFQLGRDAQTALGLAKELYQAAIYETAPVESALEIFYESSTSGKIEDLNFEISFGRDVQETEFFNSMWMKKIATFQPTSQGDNFGSRGAGSSPGTGVWPLSNVYAPPQTYLPASGTGFPAFNASLQNYNWYIEESRIRGGFNNAAMDIGARAFLDEEEPIQQHRFNALIYSGLFNSRTGLNRTNEFPVGTVITKAANPEYGSIQKIYAEETNLIVLQENKCQRALIDKDTIYTSEGGTQTQPSGTVIGQITPYAGEYGISKNPESFAIYGYQKYFIDRNRNAALRLSHNGLTEISEYGMRDWFRDNLANMQDNFDNSFDFPFTVTVPTADQSFFDYTASSTDLENNTFVGAEVKINIGGVFTSTGVFVTEIDDTANRIYLTNSVNYSSMTNGNIKLISKNRSYIIGGWDIYNKQYVCSLQYNKSSEFSTTGTGTGKDYTYYTLGFDEKINGWPSFYTYRPAFIGSIKNKYYSINNFSNNFSYTGIGDFGIYEQYKDNVTNTNRGVFYGNSNPSTVTIIANANPSVEKNFLTIDYEGSSGWKVVAAGSTGSPGNLAPIFSDQTGEDFYGGLWQYHVDKTNQIYSYYEGQYDSANPPNTGGAATVQPIFRVGFNRKENRYVANFINNSDPAPGEVIFGDKMSGIKGYYNIVTLSTDSTTAPGKMKELYQVGLSYNISST